MRCGCVLPVKTMRVEIDGIEYVPVARHGVYTGWTLGSALKSLRQDLSMTIDEASSGICSRSYLCELEADARRPGFRIIAGLAIRYGISLDALSMTKDRP